jgi:hypothetical protein
MLALPLVYRDWRELARRGGGDSEDVCSEPVWRHLEGSCDAGNADGYLGEGRGVIGEGDVVLSETEEGVKFVMLDGIFAAKWALV